MNDLISRQAAIDALDDELTITGKTNAIIVKDYVNRVANKIKRLPSAERWIPCSKDMPEENHETGSGVQFSADVLVTVINHANDGEKYTWVAKTVDGKWYDYSSTPHCIPNWCEVIAWMPLPEPYREGEEE